jgi:hypothetical protein
MLNDRVPAARTLAFTDLEMKAAKENEQKFFEGWKSYRAANPVEKEREDGRVDDSQTERIMTLLGESNDEQAPLQEMAHFRVPAGGQFGALKPASKINVYAGISKLIQTDT